MVRPTMMPMARTPVAGSFLNKDDLLDCLGCIEGHARGGKALMSSYHVPRKAILTKDDLTLFQASDTHAAIVDYIDALNDSVLGVKLSDDCPVSPVCRTSLSSPYSHPTPQAINAITSVLDNVEQLAVDTPPVNNSGSRFGNPAFKTFYDKLAAVRTHIIYIHTHTSSHADAAGALITRWPPRPPPTGNPRSMRLLYRGVGEPHTRRLRQRDGAQLSVLAVRADPLPSMHCPLTARIRICLQRLGVVQESDHTALVVRVFWRYIQVMRVLQSSYWLEPAGSHGVWGLDDYHFLPFLFGSAQLRGTAYLACTTAY
jgi:serine/threonine-protein phosphatase 2A activator